MDTIIPAANAERPARRINHKCSRPNNPPAATASGGAAGGGEQAPATHSVGFRAIGVRNVESADGDEESRGGVANCSASY